MNAGERLFAADAAPARLEELRFDNTYSRLAPGFHTRLVPQSLPEPYLVAFNPDAAQLIGLDPGEASRPEFPEFFCGNRLLPGSDPLAALYAGHQFGVYVPQLGDGRAHLLGEAVGPGEQRWDLQLKGAGRTPYSRMGDGRAVLRSTIREYLASEAMHALGIPSTRSLAIVGSDKPVIRENVETAAVLTRMAPCHVRFGSFEVFYHRRQYEHLRTLADYVIGHHFPELGAAERPHAALLREIVRRTALMVARWQAVGFCHGVMNTDNMSVLGITIDYGPYGFLDAFDAGHVCNHSDDSDRYAYNRQPGIAQWNLACLAQAMLPLMTEEEATDAVSAFETDFESVYAPAMRAKFGLETARDEDAELLRGLFVMLQENRADYTIFFRRLSRFNTVPGAKNDELRDLFIVREAFDRWAGHYRARLLAESSIDGERAPRMQRTNPKFVLRNHLAETAIRMASEERDYSEIDRLRLVLSRPFEEQPENEAYAGFPPDWASGLEVSCSS